VAIPHEGTTLPAYLSQALLKRLGVGGTARNWRTVVAIEGPLSRR
jgi:hypothetical protein